MTTLRTPPPPQPSATRTPTIADLLERLGNVPPGRILVQPTLGDAVEADILEIDRRENRLCELVDGVLVEKVMGYRESVLAAILARYLGVFVASRNLGFVSGADGLMRLIPGLVRMPDVAFASWARLPGGRLPTAPIPDLIPDLAVEVLSEGNTEAEMARKRREYFEAGVRLVWIVDPEARTVAVFTGPEQFATLDVSQTLDGGDVLPGFALPLRDLFDELDRRGG